MTICGESVIETHVGGVSMVKRMLNEDIIVMQIIYFMVSRKNVRWSSPTACLYLLNRMNNVKQERTSS